MAGLLLPLPSALLPLLAAPVALLEPASAQAPSLPPGVAARVGVRTLSLDEFDGYLAERFGGKEEGEEALRQIARCRIVEEEAARRGIGAEPAEVRAKREEIDRRLREAGEGGIGASLRSRGMEAEAFDELLRLGLLHERVFRAERGLAPDAAVPPEELARWLEERIAKVETTRSNLPSGAVALVAGRPVGRKELGRYLRYLLGSARTRELLVEAAGSRLVEERARELGIVPQPADFEAELARRRARIAESPNLRGVSFEDFLRATGSSVEELRADPRFRTAVLLEGILSRTTPPERLAEQFRTERSRLEGLHGEGRRASAIFLRAAPKPDGKVARTFEEALAELSALAAKSTDADSFEKLARLHSEHEDSKASGGDLGVLHREEKGTDPGLLEAAFRAEPGRVAGPVRLADGAALLFVHEKVPSPDETALVERLRAELRNRLYRDLLGSSPLTTYLD